VTGEDAGAALREGEAAFAAGDLGRAETLFAAVLASGHAGGWAAFFLGRLRRERGSAAGALAMFDAAATDGGPAFWTAYERLALVRSLDPATVELAAAARALLDAPAEELVPAHGRELMLAGQRLYDEGERETGAALLRRLEPLGVLSPLARARAGLEADAASGAAAVSAAEEGLVPYEVPRVLERRLMLVPGDGETRVLLAAAVGHGPMSNVVAAAAGCGPGGDVADAAARLAAALAAGDGRQAHALLLARARLTGVLPRGPAVRAAAMLTRDGDAGARDELLALLDAFHPGDEGTVLARLDAAVAEGDWEAAEAVLAAFPDPAARPPAVRLAAAELVAARGAPADALAMLDGLEAARPLRLRLLGELGRWGDLLAEGLAGAGTETRAAMLALLMRAARATGRTGELRDAFAAAAPDPARAAALAALSPVAAGAEGEGLAIFTCADAAYLEPALAMLASLAATNAGLAGRAAVQLVAAPDALVDARRRVPSLGQALGFAAEVVDGGALVMDEARLRTGYGMVTGGERLAAAAYYRIYHARALARAGRHRTAIYLDADAMLRPGLAELAAPFGPAPLAARAEAEGAAVRRAAAMLGIGGAYFNSGVLRFALDHPALGDALDRAVAAAEDGGRTLIYHDQCALNLGFDGLVDPLPRRFNHFVRPAGAEPGEADAVVLHYLDRPKPWDAFYPGPARDWRGWAALAAKLAPGSMR